MVIYLNEEGAYLSWLARHRQGFVLDGLRKPTRKRATLHRAACPKIRKAPSKKTHWTTGRRLKACALDLDELDVWAKEEFGGEPAPCEVCLLSASTSQGEPSPGEHGHRLTKLAREILDCVIDSALIHLDNGDSDYDLTLEILAERLRKSPAQIAPALERLVEDSLLRVEGSISHPSRCRLYPTAQALRSLAAFEAMPEAELAGELERLYLTPIDT